MDRDITTEVMRALQMLGTPTTPRKVYLALSGRWIKGRGKVYEPPLINEGPQEALQVYATLQGLMHEGLISSEDIYARTVQAYYPGFESWT